MSQQQLPFETVRLEAKHDLIAWPGEVSEKTYTLVYTHSHLKLLMGNKPLDRTTLYEAWAFDGKKSWHIWQRDREWVCTAFDTTKIDEKDTIEVEQYLARHFRKSTQKSKLIIHQSLAYDKDGQAYIAYACPLNLK